MEVDRVISPGGTFTLGGQVLVGAAILAGRQVGIRVEPSTLLLFDLQTQTLLRTRPNPLPAEKILRLRSTSRRPATPASARAGPGAAPRRSHRCRLGLRPTRRAGS